MIKFKAYQSHRFSPFSSFFSVSRNLLCQRDVSVQNKHIPKLPRFVLHVLRHSSENGCLLMLLNGAEQKSLKNKCDWYVYLCHILPNSFVSNGGHEGPCACTCVLNWAAMHPCVCICVWIRAREKEGSHKSPCGVSVGRYCGVSSSACGIPSVYSSTSCPSKEAWNSLWVPWQETRTRSALWFTSWPSAKPSSHSTVVEMPREDFKCCENTNTRADSVFIRPFQITVCFFAKAN